MIESGARNSLLQKIAGQRPAALGRITIVGFQADCCVAIIYLKPKKNGFGVLTSTAGIHGFRTIARKLRMIAHGACDMGAVASTAKPCFTVATMKGHIMLKRIGLRAFGTVFGFLALTGIVSAHHGVTGRYDASAPIILDGTVTAAKFAPPHPVFTVRVEAKELPVMELGRQEEYFGPLRTRAEDVGVERDVELSPVPLFYDLADRLRVGDRVTIVALRNCLSPHQLRSTWVQLSDGEVVSYTGDWARGVDGCN
jgi:hypothetical protein